VTPEPLANEAGATSGRDPAGRFTAGNVAAVKSGIYAAGFKRGDVPADLRMTAEDFRDGIVADLGGLSEMSTIERAYAQRLSDIDVTARMLLNDLIRRGLFTERGRVRSCYGRLLETYDRFDRFAQRLGMARRAKRVDVAAQFAQLHREDQP
jgi:hypothetical protein